MSGPRQVVLVGPRGAGKSSLGEALATALAWPLVDTDAALAARVGCPAGEYLRRVGEPCFRSVEQEVVLESLAQAGPQVCALGGGAVLSAAVRTALADHALFTVFLFAPREVLVDRLRVGGDRPALTDLSLAEEVRQLWTEREALYREVADLDLDTNSSNVPACVAVITGRMRAPG